MITAGANGAQTLIEVRDLKKHFPIIKGVFLKGMPALIVFQLLWPLAVIAVVTLSASSWLFRHRVE